MCREVGYLDSILQHHHQTSYSCSPVLFLGILQFFIPMDQVQEATKKKGAPYEEPQFPSTLSLPDSA